VDRALINPETALADVLSDMQRRLRTVEKRTSWPSPTFRPSPTASGALTFDTSPTWTTILPATPVTAGAWLFHASADIDITLTGTTVARSWIRVITVTSTSSVTREARGTVYGVSGNVLNNTVSVDAFVLADDSVVVNGVLTGPDTLSVRVDVAASRTGGSGTAAWSNPYIVGVPF
jgi:hypothetical protein